MAGCCFSKVENYPLPIIEQPMIFSIYLGFGSGERANKISQRFKSQGLVVKVSPAKRYKTAYTSEWVTPLQYLKSFS